MLPRYTISPKDTEFFLKKRIAIIGFGSQGSAQAENLRDSGADVIVGNRPGKSFDKAVRTGFDVYSVSDAVKKADVIALMLPDESAAEIYEAEIAPHLKKHQTLLFAHGFNIHYKFITPPADADVVMVAPKGVGPMVRKLYVDGGGVPSLVAVAQDASGNALKTALGYAAGIGSSRSAILASSFKDETETDLFGEQAVICGGIPELIQAAFTTLVDAGYPPELAYSECAHEVKLVVDLMYAGGLSAMHDSVSKTAGYGGISRGKRLVSPDVKEEMQNILKEVQSGKFAEEWIREKRNGGAHYKAMVDEVRTSDLEAAGKAFREIIREKQRQTAENNPIPNAYIVEKQM
ncbi:MAG TPA: ketol-acid reductoisomerase [Methanocorpusculum sp.]|nr:ketol-acid reductoisomerase [Methanocorpusculum sp.]